MTAIARILATERTLVAVLTDQIEAAWDQTQSWGEALDSGWRLVTCRCESIPRLDELIDRIVRALADVALADWPNWYGTSLPAEISENLFERNSSLRERLKAVSGQQLTLIAPWLRRAAGKCLRGEAPFDDDSPRELGARQLALAISPGMLVIVLGVGPTANPSGASVLAAAAEWLNRVTGATILLLLPAHWQHEPAVQRSAFGCEWLLFGQMPQPTPSESKSIDGLTVTVTPLPGRPHPGSPAEQELYRRIQADAELAALLEFNQSVAVELEQKFRIDVLCRTRRVAVEIDGEDHRVSACKYAADCERDYRLMKHGYLVLRIPNDLVLNDPNLAIARIRDILRHRAQ